MNNSEKIKICIEAERQKLNRLAQVYGLRSKRVIHQSVILDGLINQYNKIMYADMKLKKPIA